MKLQLLVVGCIGLAQLPYLTLHASQEKLPDATHLAILDANRRFRELKEYANSLRADFALLESELKKAKTNAQPYGVLTAAALQTGRELYAEGIKKRVGDQVAQDPIIINSQSKIYFLYKYGGAAIANENRLQLALYRLANEIMAVDKILEFYPADQESKHRSGKRTLEESNPY